MLLIRPAWAEELNLTPAEQAWLRGQAVVRDITDAFQAHRQLAESEARFRDMMESMTDGFVALDRDWRYLYVNQRAGEMLGQEPATLLGRNIWEVFPEGIGQPFYHAYQKAMAERQPIVFEEYYAPEYNLWLCPFDGAG